MMKVNITAAHEEFYELNIRDENTEEPSEPTEASIRVTVGELQEDTLDEDGRRIMALELLKQI